MDNTMATKEADTMVVATHLEKAPKEISSDVRQHYSIVEKMFATKTYTARYPNWMVGRKLLWMTSIFGSLGDALFGYDQGMSRDYGVPLKDNALM